MKGALLVVPLAVAPVPVPVEAQAQRRDAGPLVQLVAPSFQVEGAASAIEIDGHLDEPAWAAAAVLPLLFEWSPGDNATPPVATEALLTFDAERIYVGFRAADPDPRRIRAHLRDRDQIESFDQDDHVLVMFDTFNDKRRAFEFRINPLGVQVDAIYNEVTRSTNYSWNIIWASAAHITQDGYHVELSIPLSQIQVPSGAAPQTWGIAVGRSYPRERQYRIRSHPRDRRNKCQLCQINKVTGFGGHAVSERSLELDPTLVLERTDERQDVPDGELETRDEELDPGVTLRWGVTPSFTLGATLNPDFSQVEADVAQLDVNERFALFFPETRPFFLEGTDYFATPFRSVFTRTVTDPEWGLRLTGKSGRDALGAFVTSDEVTEILVPAKDQSRVVLLSDAVTGGVVRYRRDVLESSTLGFVTTVREGHGYHNRVGGADGFLRLSKADSFTFQILVSDTDYPEELAAQTGQRIDPFGGSALWTSWDHTARRWIASARLDHLSGGFRADWGFVPQVDIRTGQGSVLHRFWGDDDRWFDRFDIGVAGSRSEDQDGSLIAGGAELFAEYLGPLQTRLRLSVQRRGEAVRGLRHDGLDRINGIFEIQPSGDIQLSVRADVGEVVDVRGNRQADQVLLAPSAAIRVGRHLDLHLSHALQRLTLPEGELFEANLSELRLVHYFNIRSFVRTILQWSDLRQSPELIGVEFPAERQTLLSQLLFSYKVNPTTVLFVGYSDTRLGTDEFDLVETARTLFVKLGYAWLG